ncbi:MAG: UDP-3-O-(3-hydroxymyristoyl)glucosamine N-acyltransferase [Pseudomonadota bacterium]
MTDIAPSDGFRPDPRFFLTRPSLPLIDAIQVARVEIAHSDTDQRAVSHVAPLARAMEGAATFAETARDLEGAASSDPALVLTTEKAAAAAAGRFPGATIAVAPVPKAAFARLAEALHCSLSDLAATEALPDPIDPKIAKTAYLGKGAIVMPGAQVGADVVIGPCSVIGPGVIIGEGTRIGAHVSIGHAQIGRECVILAGARIGEAGFGYVAEEGRAMSLPQLGRVLIGDHVDIGANSTVDRGTLGDTVIGDGTKIDNLVQVAHNCRLGRGVLIASQVGISGSCEIGDGVMIGGQAGMADHLTIGDGAVVSAKSGLMKDIPPGERWGGIPAKPAREWMKDVAALSKLTKKGGK